MVSHKHEVKYFQQRLPYINQKKKKNVDRCLEAPKKKKKSFDLFFYLFKFFLYIYKKSRFEYLSILLVIRFAVCVSSFCLLKYPHTNS